MNTRSEEYEPIFLFGMNRVSYKPREIIRKGSFGFLKRDIMFLRLAASVCGSQSKAR